MKSATRRAPKSEQALASPVVVRLFEGAAARVAIEPHRRRRLAEQLVHRQCNIAGVTPRAAIRVEFASGFLLRASREHAQRLRATITLGSDFCQHRVRRFLTLRSEDPFKGAIEMNRGTYLGRALRVTSVAVLRPRAGSAPHRGEDSTGQMTAPLKIGRCPSLVERCLATR